MTPSRSRLECAIRGPRGGSHTPRARTWPCAATAGQYVNIRARPGPATARSSGLPRGARQPGLGDVELHERRLHVRAATSKSVHSREVTIPIEALKALDGYIADHRKSEVDEEAPLFTDRHGRPLTGNAIRKLFERLKVRMGVRDLCAHMLRHTWATNFHRSGSGSRFDLMVEGGWTTGRMVERTRRRAPSRSAAEHRPRSPRRAGR